MGTMASQITILTIVYSTVYSGADQRKHQSSALLAFVRGIHRGPVNSPHKWPVTRKMFPFDDVIMTVNSSSSIELPDPNWECSQTKLQKIGNKAIEYTGSYFTPVKVSSHDVSRLGVNWTYFLPFVIFSILCFQNYQHRLLNCHHRKWNVVPPQLSSSATCKAWIWF